MQNIWALQISWLRYQLQGTEKVWCTKWLKWVFGFFFVLILFLSTLFVFLPITNLFLGFVNINLTKKLYIYFSGLGKLVLQRWAAGILMGFNHCWRYAVFLKLDTGYTFLGEILYKGRNLHSFQVLLLWCLKRKNVLYLFVVNCNYL